MGSSGEVVETDGRSLRSVELFAGAGGLALGCELAGFKSSAVLEWDKWACDTIRQNKEAGFPLVRDWSVFEGDVRDFDWSQVEEPIDLVAGGPPCQPFSMGGKHQAFDDSRDMFPATTEVIRTLSPRAFIIENVKGLTRATFSDYFEYIQLRLSQPENVLAADETWYEHKVRLAAAGAKADSTGLRYRVVPTLVNAANFGVPQQRQRVFLVGFREDLTIDWMFPQQTHSKESLLHSQWVTGEYWDRHQMATRSRPDAPSVATVDRLRGMNPLEQAKPWLTVRDALMGLPAPVVGGSKNIKNHLLQEGARTYAGHTGSSEDLPAKTLKAGGHGVPGGENMVRRTDGSVQYFTIRESARLQTFPDAYELHGAWGEAMRQLGNAVPVRLAETVARSVASGLESIDTNCAQSGTTVASPRQLPADSNNSLIDLTDVALAEALNRIGK